ncbi:MAG: NOL1/NOP2/sun family putative RNA methylase [Candidatus Woesearchaeota archaeon]
MIFQKRYKKWGFEQPKTIQIEKTLRIHSFTNNDKEILQDLDSKILVKKISYLPHGYTVQSPFSLASSKQYILGQLYIQDAASQVPVALLDPKPADRVLEIGAAPGGKTTQLAQHMNNQGEIIAVDIRADRIRKLIFNLERCGVTNTSIIHEDARYLDCGTFDKVLLDAPCSGNYAIDPQWYSKRTLEDVQTQSLLQKELVEKAISVLKPGGILLYATCSLEIEENEHVIEWALSTLPVTLIQPQSPIVDIAKPGLTQLTKYCLRFWPTLTKTQGFFVAILQKNEK